MNSQRSKQQVSQSFVCSTFREHLKFPAWKKAERRSNIPHCWNTFKKQDTTKVLAEEPPWFLWASRSCEGRDFPWKFNIKIWWEGSQNFPWRSLWVDSGSTLILRWKLGANATTQRVSPQIKMRSKMSILDSPSNPFNPMFWTVPPPPSFCSQTYVTF